MKANIYYPLYGAKWYPEDMAGVFAMNDTNGYLFVDGDKTASGGGKSWEDAYKTVVEAVAAANAGDTIFIAAKTMAATDSDPSSYTENITISKTSLSLIGVSRGRTQGGLPQIKVGSTTSSPIIDIKASGTLIANLGINGIGGTGGGIRLYDDGGTTSAIIGTTITGSHFKNCVGGTATDSRTGGAIYWHTTGGAWQTSIVGNQFYKNVGSIVLRGTSISVPQDVLIAENDFMGTAATVDSYLYLAGGSGMSSVMVRNNNFASVLPALSSGSVVRYADLTGCTGLFANNFFASTDTTTGFGAAKASAKIPTTVGLAHNYSDGGLIVREA